MERANKMVMRIASLYALILISLMSLICCSNYPSVYSGEYGYNAFSKLPSARVCEYKMRFVDSAGSPIPNKKMHLKQIRQSFMLNNREGFTNFIWLETTDKKLRGFGSKKSITAEDIIKALSLDDLAKEHNLDMYLDLRIPVSFVSEGGVPEGTGIGQYESVEICALRQYHKAFNTTGVIPDYVHILPEFNQKMNLDLHFETEAAVNFANRYIRLARELFPKSNLVVDLGPLYCFDDFRYPIGSNGDCIYELKNGKIPGHMDFVQILEEKGSPYDVIGIEYQPGSHHSPEFGHFREFFDRLSTFGKPIFIWEFWVLSGDLTEPDREPNYGMYVFNKPDGGWTEEYQKTTFEKVLGYINDNPQIVGLTQFGWKDCMKDCGPSPAGAYGLIQEDGIKKPSYYVMQDWYESWFTEWDIVTDSEGRASFSGLPGRYRISDGIFRRKIVDLEGGDEKRWDMMIG